MRRLLFTLCALLALAAPAAAINLLQDYDPSTKAGDPAWFADAITPSDSADLAHYCTAVWVGGSGNLFAVTAGALVPGESVAAASSTATLFQGINSGQWMPVRVGRIMASNTTATEIVCVYR
jgi:hypothetical protein